MKTKLKAISPLIAVIMLIAFTMVVAGILAAWAVRFSTTQKEELQFCSRAQLLIQNGYIQSNTLYLAVYNTGRVPLSGFTMIAKYENGTVVNSNINQNISAQDIKTFSMSIDNNKIETAAIQSVQCAGAQDMLDKFNIKGSAAYP